MRTKLYYYTLVFGLGLSVSALAQTNETVQTTQPEETPETVQSTETAQPIPLENTKSSKWSFDVSLYALAPAMSGDVTVKGIPADLDLDFDKIWDNLDSAGMGTVSIGYGRWTLTTDVIYMGLEGYSKNGILDVEFDQWLIEPTLGFQIFEQAQLFAGVRYNNLSGEISGGGLGINPSGTQDWYDPIIGGEIALPLTEKLSLNARGDVGGFGVGSDLTYQAFPYLDWQFTQWGSIQAGYRWLYMDYEDGTFRYDVTTQGSQLGLTAHF